MRAAPTTMAGVKHFDDRLGDNYIGTAQALLDAGIVTLDQLPGMPGMPKISVSFLDGEQLPRQARAVHDERWMRVSLYGNKVIVSKGISAEERERREVEKAAADEAKRKACGIPAVGVDAAALEVAQASAQFQLGDVVMVGGIPGVVTGPFRLRAVCDKRGEYVDHDGGRLTYQPGYVCRDEDGAEYFWPAHKVRLPDGSRSHLRLVRERVEKAAVIEPAATEQASWPFPIVGDTFMGEPLRSQGLQA
ncbi:hypothetical protein BH10PSE18_BH10PSE18_07880 [soil metagenome]